MVMKWRIYAALESFTLGLNHPLNPIYTSILKKLDTAIVNEEFITKFPMTS